MLKMLSHAAYFKDLKMHAASLSPLRRALEPLIVMIATMCDR